MGPPLEMDRYTIKNKAKLVVRMQHQYAAKFSLEVRDFCCWVNERMTNLLWTTTGFDEYKDVKAFELAGERIVNLTRIINLREGMTVKDDTLPQRIFEDPVKTGPAAGQVLKREDFEKMITKYYQLRGWDSEGRPTAEKLKELNMDDVMPNLSWLKPAEKKSG